MGSVSIFWARGCKEIPTVLNPLVEMATLDQNMRVVVLWV